MPFILTLFRLKHGVSRSLLLKLYTITSSPVPHTAQDVGSGGSEFSIYREFQ